MAQRVSRAIENIRYRFENKLEGPDYPDQSPYTLQQIIDVLKEAEEEAKKIEERNAEDVRCNGFTNYATWRIGLEIVGDLAESYYTDGTKFDSIRDLADAFEQGVEEAITGYGLVEEGLALDYANAFANDVNYYELAEHHADELLKPVMMNCPDCEGGGEIWVEDDEDWIECERCDGTGEVEAGSDEA